MAHILLFNPPAPGGGGFTREGRCTQEAGVWATQWPPLSLTTAAALLEADGHSVEVQDFPAAGLDLKALGRMLTRWPFRMACWSTATPTLEGDLAVARLVKSVSPATTTAVFGTHVSARPEDALAEPAVDLVIRGEPEGILRALCRVEPDRLSDVAGISCRQTDPPGIRHNPDAPLLPPEEIPPPAWHLIDPGLYRLPLKGRPFLMVAPVRGCPFRCSFCTAPLYYGTRLRRRPVEAVLKEIEDNLASFGIRDLFIWADTFTADRSYVHAFCQAIRKRGLEVSWTCNSRVDTIDPETLALMRDAGLWMISFGLESGDDALLERSGKKMTVAQSRQAVLWAKEAGVRVAGHFIFGLPGETEETLARTLALALELPLDIAQFYAAAPFPGTALYDEAAAGGWLAGDEAMSQSHAVMNLPGLPAARIDAFRRYAFRRFYGRPRAVWNLWTMAEAGALKGLPASLKRFIGWTG